MSTYEIIDEETPHAKKSELSVLEGQEEMLSTT